MPSIWDGGGASESRGSAILLVDDDRVFRERMARALRDRGCSVETAGDREEAIALFDKGRFDSAVIDLRMPGSQGLELLSELRSRDPATRIVVLTGYGSVSSAIEAMRQGAHAYLPKPADAEDLLHAIRSHPPQPHTGLDERVASHPSLARAEWEHIERVLSDCRGNVSETARRLGITRRTLQLKLKKVPPPPA
jgi:two-component system, response regulator RegA